MERKKSMQKEYTLVLVRTEGAINIGLCARAMKNFGVQHLILVQAQANHLSSEAMGYAPHARDILENTQCYHSLKEALSSFDLSIGFSRRKGKFRRQDMYLKELPSFLNQHGSKRIALVFGNEQNGLSDEELRCTNLCVAIESSDEHPSLNLSHSAALILYTLSSVRENPNSGVTFKKIQDITETFFSILSDLDYFDKPDRKEDFEHYMRKILTRGIREESDHLVVDNLLLRLRGILKRKLKSE